MKLSEATRVRHAVRRYTEEPIAQNVADELEEIILQCNTDGGLHMELKLNDPAAFDDYSTAYGVYKNARNLVIIVSDGTPDTDERCGYYGAQVLLKATQLGLDTAWIRQVDQPLAKGESESDEPLRFAIVLGYGVGHGHPHRSRDYDQVASVPEGMSAPDWFRNGVEVALLAPTSLGQQSFTFVLQSDGRTVEAKPGPSTCGYTDLGIAKYHFEIGAGPEAGFGWA
ncbi:nitroreductase [Bifidobacterium commune]|uniref:Putative nitroreductase TM1586 domain-containing protein n=1 Tax=Bifidobacterium commune TaxID=1505727 RepID=A0A1C4H1W2_9BIFI|nr:nitroreductase family protein [Bifidobacterium commune]MBB2954877.1 nitroreductase [Bifidobacterium commune]SCC78964.1 hypothetical protein GA0061077_0510 [Bifidobacterium commune]